MRRILAFLTMLAALPLAGELDAQSQVSVNKWFGALACGGSVTGASANTLGGLGHFSVGLTGTLTRPDIGILTASAGSASGVLRLGVLSGSTLGPGIQGIGSLDVYFKAGQMFVNAETPSNAGHLGGGIVLGLLRNSIISPAVSLTLGWHKTASLDVTASSLDFDIFKAEVSTFVFRAEVSKNLFVVTPYAGLGANRNNAKLRRILELGTERTETDAVYYAGIEWNILLLRIGIELGRTGDQTYGTLGTRLTL
ncbi:MAG: hypothetical protein V1794_00545 [Candidatus Glassbacteria bacterium]